MVEGVRTVASSPRTPTPTRGNAHKGAMALIAQLVADENIEAELFLLR